MHDLIIITIPVITSFLAHFTSANLYATLCAQLTPWGVIQSLMITGSPLCSTILSVINYTQYVYGGFIIGIGAYLLKLLTSSYKQHNL